MVWLEQLDYGDRFKKDGPMLAEDWERLDAWLKEKGIPRQIASSPEIPKTRFNKGKMTPEQRAKNKEWLEKNANPRTVAEPNEPKRDKKPINALMKRIKAISTPRYITEKYTDKSNENDSNVKKSTLNFVPSERLKILSIPKYIVAKAVKKRASCPDLPRVKLSALTYHITPRIDELARPRTAPDDTLRKSKYQKQQQEDEDAFRKKKSKKKLDKKYRRFFMENRTLPKSDMSVLPQKKNKFKTLKELEPTMKKLSVPRNKTKKFDGTFDDPTKVKKSALTAKASPGIEKLSKPKSPKKKGPEPPWEPVVSKNALKAVASERIKKLAKPRPDLSIIRAKNKRGKRLRLKCYY